MKTLVDLAFEWNEILIIRYGPQTRQWRAYFLTAHIEESKRSGFGFGVTPDEALKSYAQNIRGRKLQFESHGQRLLQVPEVLSA